MSVDNPFRLLWQPLWMRHGLVVVALLLFVAANADASCPAPSPCSCEMSPDRKGVIINCRHGGLTTVPTFQRSAEQYYELTLAHNNLQSIPASAFDGLIVSRIDLSENEITQIADDAFGGVESSLEELLLHVNRMTQFPAGLSRLNKLKLLNLNGFNLPSLPSSALATFTQLQELTLESCKLESLSSSDIQPLAENLRLLSLVSNSFSTWPLAGLPTMPNLITLYLAHNEIAKIPDNGFGNTPKLVTLELNNNYISTIGDDAFIGTEETLSDVDLGANLLTNRQLLPLGILRNLTKLVLSNNPSVTDIPEGAFRETTKLQHLRLVDNGIQTLTKSVFAPTGTSLKVLILNGNQISRIEDGFFSVFTRLEDLYLNQQILTANLNNNTFLGLQNTLKVLDLTKTEFKVQNWPAITGLSRLTSLQLEENPQTASVPDYSFQSMLQLTTLNLKQTGLRELRPKALAGLKSSLVSLQLDSNRITTLDKCLLHGGFSQLEEIKLKDNPLECDCHLKWLRQWLDTKYNDLTIYTVNWKCAGPAVHADKYFRDLKVDMFTCDSPPPDVPCEDILVTTITPSTTTTTSGGVPSISSSSDVPLSSSTTPALDIPLLLLEITNVTEDSCKVSWFISDDIQTTGFTLEYHLIGSSKPVERYSLNSYVRSYSLYGLDSSTTYEICVTRKHGTIKYGDRTTCSDITTLPKGEESKSAGANIALIAGATVGGLGFLVLLLLLAFLFVRYRSAKDPLYAKTFWKQKQGDPPPPLPPVPRMGYNSKRFSRPKPSSMEIQNQANGDLEKKLEGFSTEERDRIINMLADSARGSTTSIISNNPRYVPELPPRPPELEGYLNPQSVKDEDCDEGHIYMEIGGPYMEMKDPNRYAQANTNNECYI